MTLISYSRGRSRTEIHSVVSVSPPPKLNETDTKDMTL